MSVRHLIEELERADVRLWVEEGRLRYRAPKGVMTADRIAAVREHKEQVLDYLRHGGEHPSLSPDPEPRGDPFPLTDVQAAYLLGRTEAFAYGGVGCHGYAEFAVTDLAPARLQDVWRTLIDRHDMLRAVVHPDGHQQVLADVPDYEVTVKDLRGASRERVDEALASIRAELSHRVYRTDEWPLFELRVTTTDEYSLIHLSIDLLIADFVSIQLLADELSALYADPSTGLPPLTVSFRDYVLAERRARSGTRYERDRRYWLDRVDDLPAAPELPVLPQLENRVDEDVASAAGFRRWGDSLPPDVWSALRRASASQGLTVSGAVLAAYAEVIGRWSRSERFTLNLTLQNRLPLHPEVGRLVGDFTSVSLLAVDGSADATFRGRAHALHARLRQDVSHRTFSGVEVMREIARREGQQAALMPVVFTSMIGANPDGAAAGTPEDGAGEGLTGELGYGLSQTPQVWIDCQVSEREGALHVNWDVREAVFPHGLIDDAFAAFVTLLRRLATDHAAWDESRPVPLPARQEERRVRFNDTTVKLDQVGGLLHDGVLAQAGRTPHRPAVISPGDVLSYTELTDRAFAVAEALRDDGIKPGDLVAVAMDKGWEQIAGVLGILLSGAAYLPIDTNQPPVRRDTMLADAGVRQILTQSWSRSSGVPPAGGGTIEVDSLAPRQAPPRLESSVAPDDLAYVIYTSGSSGTPKGVMISHRSALNTIADINARFGVQAADRVLGLANLGFDLSVYDIFGPLSVGGCLVLPDAGRRRDPSHWAELVADHGVTVWNSVPAHLQMLQRYLGAAPRVTLPSLRLALLSGDWIPVCLPDQIRGRIPGLELISLGGATEASIWSIHYPIGKVPADWRSIPYGSPLANQTFHVLDGQLRECPDWKVGELYIGGAGLSMGYLGDETKTAERFVRDVRTGERLYRTGDLGRHLPTGVIEFLGREDSQVKIKGHRIELAEVEAAMSAHPDVEASVALVDGTDGTGRRLVGVVQPGRRDEPDKPSADNAARLAEAAEAAGRSFAAAVDPRTLAEAGGLLDEAALLAMARALREQDLFASLGASHSADEIVRSASVAPRHQRLIRRWLCALDREGMVTRDELTGRYHSLREADIAEIEQRWSRLETITATAGHGAELMRYLRVSTERLPELMRDELDPLALLFPEGRLETAEAAYRDNLLSAYLNQVTIAVVQQLAAGQTAAKPLRLLEIGAGVGGTSAELIPALAGLPVDYLFTDVSRFFLNEAQERFRDYPWVRYDLFDINKEGSAQGIAPNSVDVMVCANVLHNARHAGKLLERLRELLAPGGWLVFVEATRDSYPLMVSMEFKHGLGDFEDFRRDLDQTFVSRTQWLDLLEQAGAETLVCLPGGDDAWSDLGQHVFAARFKADRAALRPEDLAEQLSERLPDHMIPSQLQVVDAMPLSANGKLDRTKLLAVLPHAADGAALDVGSQPVDDLERRIAAVWAQVLDLSEVGRDQDFFALGGDSLLVAQLISQLRHQVPEVEEQEWDGLLRRMLVQPTVAALASHLRDAGAEAEPGGDCQAGNGREESPLAPLSPDALPGKLGAGEPVGVFLHDGSGTLAPYRSLVTELTARHQIAMPLVGFAVNDIDPYLAADPGVLIEQLAERYATRLVEQVGATFHVVGYCMGGLLATETARKLADRGAEVASLSVVSSYRPPYEVDDELLVEYLFARVMGVDPSRAGFPADEESLGHALRAVLARNPKRLEAGSFAAVGGDAMLDGVASRMRALAQQDRGERLAAIGRELAAESSLADSVDGAAGLGQQARIGPMYHVFRQSLQAAILHRTAPWPGDITLLRHRGQGEFLPGQPADLAGFWSELCGGRLHVREVPGDHFSCLNPQHAHRSAEILAGEVWA